MKKLIVLLAVLALTVPSMAGVTLSESAKSGTTVTVNYTWDTTGNLPRAFALVLQATGGTITSVTPAMRGESGRISTQNPTGAKGFGIFPGTIQIDANGNPTDFATPVEPTGLPGGPSALGSSRVVVALGSLNAGDANKPANSGALFTVVCSGSTTALAVTEEDTYRGGVVDTAGTALTVLPLNITFAAPPCLTVGRSWSIGSPVVNLTVTQAMVDRWNLTGANQVNNAKSWCCDGQKLGNGVYTPSTTLNRVDTLDLAAVKTAWFKTNGVAGYNANVDFNLSGRVDTLDMAVVKNHWFQTVGSTGCL